MKNKNSKGIQITRGRKEKFATVHLIYTGYTYKPLAPSTTLADRTDPYIWYAPTITSLHRQAQSYHMIHTEATFGTVGSNTRSDNHAENMPRNKVK